MYDDIFRALSEKDRRSFNCIQIEPSSSCSLKCVMCPRTALGEKWKSMDMPFETFEKISRNFSYMRWVYFSGWGETLLNARIFDMIKLAKDCACSVGLTTNGMLLTEQISKKLIELGVDIVCVSIAGATRKTHEEIRVGSEFTRLTQNIRALGNLKESVKTKKPKVMLLFLMTRQNINELPLAVELAEDLGADELVGTNLSYVTTTRHDEIKAFSCQTADESLMDKIEKAEQKAKELGVGFRSFPLQTEEVLVCEEDPLNNIYVSCDGYVSPCVYLNPPVREIPRIFLGSKEIIPRTYFGNVTDRDLFEIWEEKAYRLFREKFKKRLALREEILEFNISAYRKIANKMRVNPLPEVCETCYKAYGI